MKTNLEIIYKHLISGARISTDSRDVDEKTIFFALKGTRADGNTFVEDTLARNALLAVADDNNLPNHPRLVKVDCVLETMQQLAKHHRKSLNIPVIGITGSNGKTTTKELIGAVLAQKYKTHSTPGNYNNHIGLPITMLRIKPEHEIAVIEMGANHVGEIDFLCNIAEPTHGLITNIGKAHIEGFGSAENVIVAKTELYRHLQRNQKILFVNADNPILTAHSQGYQHQINYGKSTHYPCSGEPLESAPYLKIQLHHSSHFQSDAAQINSQLIGAYNFENVLAAITIGLHFDVDLRDIVKAIENYQPTNNRSQLKDTGSNKLILDAYNANPTSMMAALSNFKQIKVAGSKAVILGDMLEMGSTAYTEHQKIVDEVVKMQFDLIILVGEEFKKLKVVQKNCHVFSNSTEAKDWIINNPLKGFHILVKGSRGIQLEILEEYL